MQDAIRILELMRKDNVDVAFIRVLSSHLVWSSSSNSGASSPSLASIHALYQKIILDKHESPWYVSGLINSGGRNISQSVFRSRAGSRNTSAIVGMVLFCQFWYWYPLACPPCIRAHGRVSRRVVRQREITKIKLLFSRRHLNLASSRMPNLACLPILLSKEDAVARKTVNFSSLQENRRNA
ncbi:hypothetical protein A0H81_13438 [Grifola frondosa]|uniref:Uncharacterized protein n=1 Tax=Grifola frondosa TaxID=5627 RepID=A0A1C7LPF9_GRIFR|nr:hypothetical protein A0H81_13438 [Grifola frondosa]